MFQHMAWADTRTLSSLREMREAPSQALDLMAHVLTAEHIWLVSFVDYDLGYFDDETGRLEPIDDPFGPRLSPMSPE